MFCGLTGSTGAELVDGAASSSLLSMVRSMTHMFGLGATGADVAGGAGLDVVG